MAWRMGHGAWGMAHREGSQLLPNAQCPMPNAQCPMPNAQCPMPMSSSFSIKRQIWNRKGDTGRLCGAAGNLVSTRSHGNAAQKLPVNPL